MTMGRIKLNPISPISPLMSEPDELEHSEIPNITALLSKYHLHIVNNYPAKSRRILNIKTNTTISGHCYDFVE